MREAISKFLCQKATENDRFYVLSGDHGYALFDAMRQTKPGQFVNAGVSEQAMIGYAAGLAKEGMQVVVYGLSAFIPLRVLEFIKMDICYENLPVIILGDGAGLVYSTLGASHQCAEDIACMRALPNMNICAPADREEMIACLETAYSAPQPTYIRIGKADRPLIHSHPVKLSTAAFLPIRKTRPGISVIATGSMVSTGLQLSRDFAYNLYSAPVLSPLNSQSILMDFQDDHTLITIEEHSIHGGLGSIVAEAIAESNEKKRLIRIGINNRFTAKCGSYEYALREHGLDYPSIVKVLNEKGLS